MTIGQLQQLAQLLALGALAETDPKKRIAMVRLADEIACKEEAVARWRGHTTFRALELPCAVREGRAHLPEQQPAPRQAA
jgi:hypothetical protein